MTLRFGQKLPLSLESKVIKLQSRPMSHLKIKIFFRPRGVNLTPPPKPNRVKPKKIQNIKGSKNFGNVNLTFFHQRTPGLGYKPSRTRQRLRSFCQADFLKQLSSELSLPQNLSCGLFSTSA